MFNAPGAGVFFKPDGLPGFGLNGTATLCLDGSSDKKFNPTRQRGLDFGQFVQTWRHLR